MGSAPGASALLIPNEYLVIGNPRRLRIVCANKNSIRLDLIYG